LREASSNGVEVAAILVTGESADTPLLTEMLSTRTDITLLIAPDPEWTTANGAATVAATVAAARPAPVRTPVPSVARPAPVARPVPVARPAPVTRPPAVVAAPRPVTAAPVLGVAALPGGHSDGAGRPRGRSSLRTALVGAAAGLAVLVAGGTAVGQAGAGPLGHSALGGHGHR
jgi:hypothetical protein